jgi:ankyrin repeat protein
LSLKRKHLNRGLLDAIVLRDITKVSELLRQGADCNARDEEHNETSLILAVKFADTAVLRLLIEQGADVNLRDDTGRTALFLAEVPSEEFQVLLQAGADIHARDSEGNTILMRKVAEGASLSEVEELLRLQVDPSVSNEVGETALELAEGLGLTKVAERLRTSTKL